MTTTTIQLTDGIPAVPPRAKHWRTFLTSRTEAIEFSVWQGTGWGIPARVDVYLDGIEYYARCKHGDFRLNDDELMEALCNA